jgi:hypothetical protein
MNDSIVVASRALELDGIAGQVRISIKQPQPDGENYRCDYKIVGLGDRDIHSYSPGVDAVQALLLACQGIGTRLYTSEEGKQGRLTWLGMKNLGFPLPNVIADLEPEEEWPTE